VNDVGEVGARQRICGVRIIGDPRYAEIGHQFLPFTALPEPPLRLRLRNGYPDRRQFD
jgi:hypothetical protein